MIQIATTISAISHGGTLVQTNTRTKANGNYVIFVGDIANCSLHGPQTVTSGSSFAKNNGRNAAYIGSSISCGATIISGEPKVQVNT